MGCTATRPVPPALNVASASPELFGTVVALAPTAVEAISIVVVDPCAAAWVKAIRAPSGDNDGAER
jgi:hypothetical protein